MKSDSGFGNHDYRLCCHACDTLQQATGVCPACGPSLFQYRLLDGKSTPSPVCSECGRSDSGADSVPPAPLKCSSCASTDLGGMDPKTKSWLPEALEPYPGEEPWICADFDGDCQWLTSPDFNKLGHQVDDLRADALTLTQMNRAQIENLEFVDGPSEYRLGTDRRPPLRLGTLPNVFVYRFQGGERRLYEVTLKDVRLHDWQQVTETTVTDRPINGRLQGKVFARLALKPDELPRQRRDIVNLPARRWKNWLGQRAGASAAAPGEPAAAPVVQNPEQPIDNYCNTCNLFLMAAVFLCLYLACSLSCALVGLLPMILQCWWRSSRLRRGLNRWSNFAEILTGIVLVVAGCLVYLAARGSACEGRPVYWWLAGLGLLLVLTAILRRCWPWFLLTLLWVLALLTYACGTQPNCELAATSVGSDSSIADAPQSSLSLPRLNPFPSMGQAFDKVRDSVEQLLAQDQDAQRVGDESTGNGRVSIDEALRHPNRYFRCSSGSDSGSEGREARRFSVYLGEAALFNKDSAVLGPGAEPHLRKLAKLIASEPNAHVILTGHADRSGQREHNLTLSQQRANAVADWLLAHKVLPAEQIEIRAVGDRQPLVNDPSLSRLNRRVEISLDCDARSDQ